MDDFLNYNSTDHSFVENIVRKLYDEGLGPFLVSRLVRAGIPSSICPYRGLLHFREEDGRCYRTRAFMFTGRYTYA
jgi:hypothetical protein